MSTWLANFTKSMIVLDSIDPPGKKGPFLVNLDTGFCLNVKHDSTLWNFHRGYVACTRFTHWTPFLKLPHFLGSRLQDPLEYFSAYVLAVPSIVNSRVVSHSHMVKNCTCMLWGRPCSLVYKYFQRLAHSCLSWRRDSSQVICTGTYGDKCCFSDF